MEWKRKQASFVCPNTWRFSTIEVFPPSRVCRGVFCRCLARISSTALVTFRFVFAVLSRDRKIPSLDKLYRHFGGNPTYSLSHKIIHTHTHTNTHTHTHRQKISKRLNKTTHKSSHCKIYTITQKLVLGGGVESTKLSLRQRTTL